MISIARGSCPVATVPTHALPATTPAPSARQGRRATSFVGRVCAAVALSALAVSVVMAQDAEPSASDAAIKALSAPEPWRTDRFYLQTSLATWHFDPSDEHDNSQALVNLEWRLDKRWLDGQVLVGAANFDNSYSQNSQYVYGGLLWRPVERAQPFYLKLTAGVIHGYKGKYKNKIPFNSSGFAPGIIPSVGYCYNRFCSELNLFGFAGTMLTFGVTLP